MFCWKQWGVTCDGAGRASGHRTDHPGCPSFHASQSKPLPPGLPSPPFPPTIPPFPMSLANLLNVAPGSISDVPADDLGSLWTGEYSPSQLGPPPLPHLTPHSRTMRSSTPSFAFVYSLHQSQGEHQGWQETRESQLETMVPRNPGSFPSPQGSPRLTIPRLPSHRTTPPLTRHRYRVRTRRGYHRCRALFPSSASLLIIVPIIITISHGRAPATWRLPSITCFPNLLRSQNTKNSQSSEPSTSQLSSGLGRRGRSAFSLPRSGQFHTGPDVIPLPPTPVLQSGEDNHIPTRTQVLSS